jgi:secreted trypsin-like serine protease
MIRILIVFAVAILGRADTNTKTNSGSLIVDDRFADISEVPYQAALLVSQSQFCGGSVISDRYILTAAICVHPEKDPKSYFVRVGSSHAHRGGTVIKVKKIIYEREKLHGIHDLALLQLEKPIPDFGTVVKSVAVREPNR